MLANVVSTPSALVDPSSARINASGVGVTLPPTVTLEVAREPRSPLELTAWTEML
jgi:hypothetical protein